MPYSALKAEPRDIVYLYDGSLAGLYCCVHESITKRELPFAVLPEGEDQVSLFFKTRIDTDLQKAQKVRTAIFEKICARALELCENVFLTCLENKELAILRFLLLAFAKGTPALDMLSHPDVAPLIQAERHLLGERHLLLGFIRFSDNDGVLAAVISPKNFVLPLIADHFIGRYSSENFMIYDKTHRAALLYQNHTAQIVPVENAEFQDASPAEEQYRALWKRFYQTIAITDRYNPVCRRTHMPKRYWENMTEMKELL